MTVASVNVAATTNEKACAVWSAFAHNAAESRDSGVSERSYYQKIDSIEISKGGFTRDNAIYAKKIAHMVYHDFRKKTPGDIATVVNVGCMVTSP